MKNRLRWSTTVAFALVAQAAHAELGGAATWGGNATAAYAVSSQTVRRMSAISVPYTVMEATLAGGTSVREYVNGTGTVFAVAWQGTHVPDLSVLLGNYFSGYQQSVEQQNAQQGGGFGPVTVERSDVVVQAGGHMGAYIGRAWLRKGLPAGVDTTDIK